MEATTELLMTKADLVEKLRISLPTINRLIRSGRLPSVNIGRSVRFRREDVEQFIDGLNKK